MSRRQARELSFKFLYQEFFQKEKTPTLQEFQNFAQHFEVTSEDQDFAWTAITETLSQQITIEEKLKDKLINWKIERLASIDRVLLLLAYYEIHTLNQPCEIVINETVELAKKYGNEKSANFINGVLDSLKDSV